MSKDISEVTRKDIINLFTLGLENPNSLFGNDDLNWNGQMNAEIFLSRLFDLHSMPSTDSRYKNAFDDIRQHCTNNSDWDSNWVFYDSRFNLLYGPDEAFLNFLCEVFHPAVRLKSQNWRGFLEEFNKLLRIDGFIIKEIRKISGHPVYGWERLADQNIITKLQGEDLKVKFNSEYISAQIKMMSSAIETAPNIAIGKAKELLESCCKTILDDQCIVYDDNLDLTQLMKQACMSIGLDARSMDKFTKSGNIAAKILGNLGAISQGMAELRNLYGDGHGKTRGFRPLPQRYADLAVGVSVAAVKFMWDTYIERTKQQPQ